jgi:hypothetical protein
LRVDLGNINVASDQLQESLKIISIKTKKRCIVHTCCDWLPAYRPIEEGPKAVMLGLLPSSSHVIENAEPAGMLVEAVGFVILEDVSQKSQKKIERYRRKRSHGQEEPGQQEKEREEKITLLRSFGIKRRSGREKRVDTLIATSEIGWVG